MPDGLPTPTERLTALARQAARLTPSWTYPETFHEAKSALIAELRALARELNARPASPAPSRPSAPPSPSRTIIEVRVVPLPRHLMRRPRHRYPVPPADPAQEVLL